MKKENLKHLSHITIGDIIEFSPIMKLSLREATPRIKEFSEKHKLDHNQIKDICRVVKMLELYS